MATDPKHAEFLANLDKLEQILTKPATKDLGQVCKVYAQIKPILQAVLPVLEKIPAIGKIVLAIRLLMSIADQFCKGQS
jgi:hypothetical protein